MHLHMYINGELIDSVEINASLLQKVKILQLQMEEKHNKILENSSSEPTYFIDGMPSRMNESKNHKKIVYN